MNNTQHVVASILALIRKNGLRRGEKLPPLRDIGDQNGVSVFAAKKAMDFLTAGSVVEARLGDGCYVADGSKIKLEQVLQELESVVSAKARQKRLSKAAGVDGNLAAVLLAELAGGFAAEYLEGVSRVLRRERFRFLLSLTHFSGSYEATEVQALTRNPAVSGLIIDPSVKREVPGYLPVLRRLRLPTVFLGDLDFGDEQQYDHVACDNRSGMRALVRHVAEQGHRHIAYVEYAASSSPANRVRHAAYKEAVVSGGLGPLPPVGLVQHLEAERVASVARMLERASPRRTAFVCFNDVLALWMIRALGQLGVRVPEDISVCGFDDRDAMGDVWPGLTTVRYPRDEAAERAAEMLVDKVAGRIPYDTYQQILLPPSLVVRESVRPLKAAKRRGGTSRPRIVSVRTGARSARPSRKKVRR